MSSFGIRRQCLAPDAPRTSVADRLDLADSNAAARFARYRAWRRSFRSPWRRHRVRRSCTVSPSISGRRVSRRHSTSRRQNELIDAKHGDASPTQDRRRSHRCRVDQPRGLINLDPSPRTIQPRRRRVSEGVQVRPPTATIGRSLRQPPRSSRCSDRPPLSSDPDLSGSLIGLRRAFEP